jgi:hypothetical protein
MSLHFPNASRSYDSTKHSVSFWGHDSTIEITFSLDESAIQKLSPQAQADEPSFLRVFDANRPRIEEAAGLAYSRKRQTYHWLSAANF